MSEPHLRLSGVHRHFGKDETLVRVLEAADLTVESGELVAIRTEKAHTTPPQFENGVLNALDKAGLDARDVDEFFASGSTRMIEDLASLSDRTFGWDASYEVLREAGLEAVGRPPVAVAAGVARTTRRLSLRAGAPAPPARAAARPGRALALPVPRTPQERSAGGAAEALCEIADTPDTAWPARPLVRGHPGAAHDTSPATPDVTLRRAGRATAQPNKTAAGRGPPGPDKRLGRQVRARPAGHRRAPRRPGCPR